MGFVDKVTVDRRPVVVDWTAVEAEIRNMEGNPGHPLLSMTRKGHKQCCFVVYRAALGFQVEVDGQERVWGWYLSDGSQNWDTVRFEHQRVRNKFPKHLFVSLDKALAAAMRFFESGVRTPEDVWASQLEIEERFGSVSEDS